MKKIFFLLFTIIVFYANSSSQCPQASAQVLTTHHGEVNEVGAYNSFGVRITLNQTYSEGVTVIGVIFDSENHSVSANFNITVPAGYTTQDADDLLNSGRESFADVTINSIWPCPSNYNIPHDSVGIYHNMILTSCMSNQSPLSYGVSYYQTLFPGAFFQETIDDIVDQATYAAVHDSTNYVPGSFSSEGQSYCSQLLSLIGDLEDSYQIDQAIDDISEFESDILGSSLSDFEKNALLYASSTAKHSFDFWLGELDTTGSIALNKMYNNPFSSLGTSTSYYTSTSELPLVQRPASFYNNDNGSTESYKKGWFRKLLRIVVGDVVGAFVGAVVTWALTEPCAVCPALGALLGGFAGSIAAGSEFEAP